MIIVAILHTGILPKRIRRVFPHTSGQGSADYQNQRSCVRSARQFQNRFGCSFLPSFLPAFLPSTGETPAILVLRGKCRSRLGAEFAKQNQQRNNRKWIPERSKRVKKCLKDGQGRGWHVQGFGGIGPPTPHPTPHSPPHTPPPELAKFNIDFFVGRHACRF